ncbi:MAG TPA: glycosyltransferase family 1 protein [Patescibacteria group bacterium]|nr:glycosyltransferase family 1 protein [Patescibacteria group bacterium]
MTKKTQKPIRIIFDASPLLVNKTGVAYYTERLVEALAKQYPNEIELIGFYYNFLGKRPTAHFPKAPNLRFRGVHLFPSQILFQLRRWGIEVPIELLAKTRGDFLLFPNFLSYPSLFKTPSAPVVHDLAYIDLPQYVSPKNGSDLRRFVPVAIKRSQFVITVSEFCKKRIGEQYNVAPDKVLVTPIPPPSLGMSEAKAAQMIKDAGFTKPYILYVGTIDPRKNLIGLIDGYCALPKELRERFSLVLVGRIERFAGKEAERIEAARAAGYDVIHPGYISDELKEALFMGASVFTYASNYEGFGMPPLEAMHYGLPCALSNIDVFREVAGDTALYYDTTKTASIAKTLAELLNDPKKAHALGEAGRKRAAGYSWEKVARSLHERIAASTGRD